MSTGSTVKPVLSGRSKIIPKLVFMTDYRLMQVKSIAECSKGSNLHFFWPPLSYHLSLRSVFCLFFDWPLKTGLLYINSSSSCLFQTYSMDCYFRQLWIDKRLAFNVSMPNVSLNIKMLERLWYPDTIFLNGGRSYVHMVPMPNKFFRINDDGTVLYSQRYI